MWDVQQFPIEREGRSHPKVALRFKIVGMDFGSFWVNGDLEISR